ncbi:ribosome biogenesis/translation initiation ATPase RLI [Haloplanus aerogenes]|uniref:Ribosome biogenesis/translation initiation ATPase RLI n=1 Tax=Haloplanus aerogenes TaxID=660522 RepID=A0A3M0D8B3_9EURY|nr:ribosome biogenesis/translation initiation ATPase RLI [Haloplanus aerogenes]AZH26872.1 ribosome biogenesis/translation initiation ATPase RLI [Haloplanus aerogenes]RMB12523.1 translation initiation factor RLI1 [Haloplanus aerogenes]
MADDSIAVVDLDRCQPDRCNYECANFCPPNRTGEECIVTLEERHDDPDLYDGGPDQISISEELCLGETCGICVEKCPFDAIEIINLPSELTDDPVHRYGENAFALYGLPVPESGTVTGLLGPNGIGKSTAVHALAGEMVPNLGQYDAEPDWETVLDRYRGTALQNYLERLMDDAVTVARKPQYVDRIPDQFDGKTRELLAGTDERGVVDDLVDRLSIRPVIDQPIDTLSGGELQRVALAATLARDADFYFLDEITPYLDIGQRVTAARLVRELADEEDRSMLVVEHDLAVLDLLADRLHVAYGEPGAYGVITDPKSVRNGINEYLQGYLNNENMRIRPNEITFEEHAPRESVTGTPLVEYPDLRKSYGEGEFSLDVEGGTIYKSEVLGVVGPNGIGKSTLAKLFAGSLEPDEGSLDFRLDIAYKPQYVEVDQPMRVDTFLSSITDDFGTSFWNTEIAKPLQLERIMEQQLTDLSGGERQRVAIAACLSKDADLYLLDEPSAHLDVEQRVQATSAIRRYAENHDATAMVIDHDIYMIDLLADRLMVFDGEPADHGHASKPQDMRSGMNDFLADLDITFRRDERTGRPRINKPESQLDREQKRQGEYYYAP